MVPAGASDRRLPPAGGIRIGECGNVSYHRLHLLDRDEARAFELARRVLVAWAPEEILVIEAMARIVPATVAGVMVDDSIGGDELVERMGEARDHHHGGSHRPGEP